jgi:Icc-related predicted phosphoesterase
MVLDELARGPDLEGVLLVGDLACAGRGRFVDGQRVEYLLEVDQVLKTVAQLGCPVAYVPGNHDVRELTFSGNIDGSSVQMGDFKIAGIGGAGPDKFGFQYEWEEDEIRGRPRTDVDVLLSHCPPAGTIFDRLPSGQHVGSEAVLERVNQMVGVAVFGHIHEAHGVGRIGDCLCMNAGGLGPPAAHPRAGWVYGTEAVVLKDLKTGEEHRAER